MQGAKHGDVSARTQRCQFVIRERLYFAEPYFAKESAMDAVDAREDLSRGMVYSRCAAFHIGYYFRVI